MIHECAIVLYQWPNDENGPCSEWYVQHFDDETGNFMGGQIINEWRFGNSNIKLTAGSGRDMDKYDSYDNYIDYSFNTGAIIEVIPINGQK